MASSCLVIGPGELEGMCLLEFEQDNFGIRSQPQWRAPSPRSTRSEDHHPANAAQAIDELTVHSACDPAPRNELPKVRVT